MEKGRMLEIKVTHLESDDLTIFDVVGPLGADDIIEYSSKYYTENPTKLVLWDVTKGSVSSIGNDEFRKIAAAVKPFTEKRRGGRTAFVGEFDAEFGMGRMYESLAKMAEMPVQYRTFRSRDEALAWLKEK